MKSTIFVMLMALSLHAFCEERAARFRIDGATVVDEQTGLRWKRCSVGQAFQSNNTCKGKVTKFNFYEAQKQTNVRPQADGFWRVPTKNELATLVDTSKKGMKIDATIFPDAPLNGGAYWTCDMFEDGAAWYVDFTDGYVGYMSGDHSSAEDRLAVRLVHVEK